MAERHARLALAAECARRKDAVAEFWFKTMMDKKADMSQAVRLSTPGGHQAPSGWWDVGLDRQELRGRYFDDFAVVTNSTQAAAGGGERHTSRGRASFNEQTLIGTMWHLLAFANRIWRPPLVKCPARCPNDVQGTLIRHPPLLRDGRSGSISCILLIAAPD
jgi:hypothetical protein